MKYIVIRQTENGIKQEYPIIFGNMLVHADVAKALLNECLKDSTVVAAGELSSLDIEPNCTGKSTSLNISSRGKEDEDLIKMLDYNHGIVE